MGVCLSPVLLARQELQKNRKHGAGIRAGGKSPCAISLPCETGQRLLST